MADYKQFLAAKSSIVHAHGLDDLPQLPPQMKAFQRAIAGWALRRGRAAIFAGTGLGKTLMQLAWARAVADHERKPVLILTPLAVAEQTVEEAARWGIPSVAYAPDQSVAKPGIVVTNYERVEKFDIEQFCGVVLDESGILKAQDGKTRALVTERCRALRWRLCCTATPAPNDYTELGQHAEFLSIMTFKEMLSMYFVHDGKVRAPGSDGVDGWRLKRHATNDFWQWVASWAVMIRSPEDLGFDGSEYALPPLNLFETRVAVEYRPSAGMLFPVEARTLSERISARKISKHARVGAALGIIDEAGEFSYQLSTWNKTNETQSTPEGARDTRVRRSIERKSKLAPWRTEEDQKAKNTNEPITNPIDGAIRVSGSSKTIPSSSPTQSLISIVPDSSAWVVWCNLNSEQDELERCLGNRCFSIYGSLPLDQKIDRIVRWIRGERPILLSKPSICGHGLNLQRCHKMIFVGLTDSFEQVYQAIRRCWRFGQARPVLVHMVASELEGAVVANLRRKEIDYEKMLDAMSAHMRELMREEILIGRRRPDDYQPKERMALPW